jgi:hypothetical protein
MKIELKTLKDIKRPFSHSSAVSDYDLRQEAIKWVKFFRNDGLEAEFIKHFFNITESDLE